MSFELSDVDSREFRELEAALDEESDLKVIRNHAETCGLLDEYEARTIEGFKEYVECLSEAWENVKRRWYEE